MKTKGSLLSAAVSAVVFAAGLLFSIGGTAGATNSACVTTGSYTACQTFLEIGSDQSFTVPTGVTALHAELWGAGGGGPNPNGYWAYQAGGGGGGYTTADIAVSPGEVFNIVVGQGGQMNSDSSTYGGGGAGGFSGYAPAVGGSGGGMSAIFHATTPLLIAGGGGGASPGAEGANLTVAGGGGGTQGGNGTYTDVSGQGGTQSTGGAAAVNPGNASDCAGSLPTDQGQPQPGSQYQGGRGGGNTGGTEGGGGGGGGYFGGGGGVCQGPSAPEQNGDGGGGSGFVALSSAGISNASMSPGANSSQDGAGGAAGNTSSANYLASQHIGQGGWTGSGGDGLVVLQWVTPTSTTSPGPTTSTSTPSSTTSQQSVTTVTKPTLPSTGFPASSLVGLVSMLLASGLMMTSLAAKRQRTRRMK